MTGAGSDGSAAGAPRGTLVFDIGSTNTKLVLFDQDGAPVMERKVASRHVPGPVYQSLDPEPALALLREHLPEFDARLPVDAIVPCAHGSALALLDADGELVLPVMDYLSTPPVEMVDAYRRVAPAFSEVFAPLNPMALTLGLQLLWQSDSHPDRFARVSAILPWGQYFAYRLTGRMVSEVTALGAQTHLWAPAEKRYSSFLAERGWDRLFAPLVRAFDTVGTLRPDFVSWPARGRLEVKAGIHDSNANYLRYLAAGVCSFTLLSTGTWIIVFDTDGDIAKLDPARDTATNTDVFGRPVACARFMGGVEMAALALGAPADAADVQTIAAFMRRGVFALPSFTDSGGPLPSTGGLGRIVGPTPASDAERASLAALYCALMVDLSLDAVGSKSDIIVDGPFATNQPFLATLATLRPAQRVRTSDLRDGTTAGAALLALVGDDEVLPERPVSLGDVAAAVLPDLPAYRTEWLGRANANAARSA